MHEIGKVLLFRKFEFFSFFGIKVWYKDRLETANKDCVLIELSAHNSTKEDKNFRPDITIACKCKFHSFVEKRTVKFQITLNNNACKIV